MALKFVGEIENMLLLDKADVGKDQLGTRRMDVTTANAKGRCDLHKLRHCLQTEDP